MMNASSARQTVDVGSVAIQLRDERRWLGLMRLHVGVLLTSWVLLGAWATPGTPLSSVPDYSAAMVLGLLLALLAAGITIAFLIVWRPSFRGEPFSEFVRVVSGAGRLIRRRTQFEARLRLECRRASLEDPFSVVMVEFASPMTDRRGRAERSASEPAIQAVLVRSIARTDDVVAEVRPSQVWVLAVGADEAGRLLLADRLQSGLTGSNIPGTDDAKVGAATYGKDALRPGALLDLAHDRLAPVAVDRPDAA